MGGGEGREKEGREGGEQEKVEETESRQKSVDHIIRSQTESPPFRARRETNVTPWVWSILRQRSKHA